MSDKYVLFCENNSSMVILEKDGDRMAAYSMDDHPTIFGYDEALAYIKSQCDVGSTAFGELYQPVHVDDVQFVINRDKSGWSMIDTAGLKAWGVANGITDFRKLRDKYPQIVALLKQGFDREATKEIESLKDN